MLSFVLCSYANCKQYAKRICHGILRHNAAAFFCFGMAESPIKTTYESETKGDTVVLHILYIPPSSYFFLFICFANLDYVLFGRKTFLHFVIVVRFVRMEKMNNLVALVCF